MPAKHDGVALEVNGRRYEQFVSYSLASDLLQAADAFSLELAGETDVEPYQTCKIWVNGVLELNGFIQRVQIKTGENGTRTVVEGLDLLGMLLHTYCTSFETLKDLSLKDSTNILLADIPWVNRKEIVYSYDASKFGYHDGGAPSGLFVMQIRPGQTVFDVLRDMAEVRGLHFFSMPDGTLVFGRPTTGGRAQFSITYRIDGRGNNVSSRHFVRDGSQEYSSITVVSQSASPDAWENGSGNGGATIDNPDVTIYCPYVKALEAQKDEIVDTEAHARALLENQRFGAWQYSCIVPGHAQNGRNWQVNVMCHVKDDHPGVNVNRDLLIYSREFVYDGQAGSRTILRLARPGVRSAS